MPPKVHAWLESAKRNSGAWEVAPELGAFGRLWRVFMTARVTIASVLVVLQAFVYALGHTADRWSFAICIVYLCATLAELKGKYPNAASNVRTLADQERTKFKCGAT